MVKSNNRIPNKWRPEGEPLPPGGPKYFAQLINARFEPETYSIPVCYRHIEGLAQSIRRREMTESVLVLVEPGTAKSDEIAPNLFYCFLCQRDDALPKFKSQVR